ncbi:Pentatricopeptide repeat [Quillaja saponaria]|uniref:Pentatricopeptide repeat n=1 Tax=Quillaja saponaria TaxID=32244 RepID=A0AAD7PJA5_QUISA|nr:Pentatricopeptide repeat [Quillaja saponaria]
MPISHYLTQLQQCARRHSPYTARKLHAQIMKAGLNLCEPLSNTLLNVYGKCGLTQDAYLLFEEMPMRNLVSWASILTAFNLANLSFRALSIFPFMLKLDRLQPDDFVLASLVKACANLGSIRQGKQVHGRFLLSPFWEDDVVKSSLVDMYAKCRLPDNARAVFDSISSVNSVSWTAMISGYARGGRKSDAVELFQGMPTRNLYSWTALISGLVQSGNGVDAFYFFIEMQREGINIVDPLVLSSIVGACANLAVSELEYPERINVGLVSKGRALFRSMTEDYGVSPSLQHYTCLLDLLSRSGHLEEAENLIDKMPFRPDEPTWAALLSACKLHGNMQMGIRVADYLLNLKPEDPSTYILLSNIYAGASMWENVSKVRKLMMNMEAKKEPGYSYVDLGKESQVFYAGETFHPLKDEILCLLRELDAEMRRRGYFPDTSSVLHDMDQQEKEKQLFSHSERLAVAYALLKAVPGTVIRIVKNLRVCGDCHTVLKLISCIRNREIYVRDSKRYHHFKGRKLFMQ